MLHMPFPHSFGNVKALTANNIKLHVKESLYICPCCFVCMCVRFFCACVRESTLLSALSGCLDTSTERLACVSHWVPTHHFAKREIRVCFGVFLYICFDVYPCIWIFAVFFLILLLYSLLLHASYSVIFHKLLGMFVYVSEQERVLAACGDA